MPQKVDLEKVEAMVNEAKKVADVIKSFSGKVRVVSHYDCDGITAGSIICRALFREGKDFQITFVKQLNEDLIKKIADGDEALVIFTDLGSGYLDLICKHLLNKNIKRKVIIADHHETEGNEKQENLLHINSMSFDTREYSLRLNTNVSTRLNARTYIQWDNEDKIVNLNFRIHFIPQIGSDIYFVYNHLWDGFQNYSTSYNTGICKIAYRITF